MAYEGLLSGLADEDKYLGLLGIGLGMLAGNQGRSRQQAMANSFGGAAQGGLGLLGPIMQNKQAQAQAADRARQFGLQERQFGLEEQFKGAQMTEMQRKVEEERRRREESTGLLGRIGQDGLDVHGAAQEALRMGRPDLAEQIQKTIPKVSQYRTLLDPVTNLPREVAMNEFGRSAGVLGMPYQQEFDPRMIPQAVEKQKALLPGELEKARAMATQVNVQNFPNPIPVVDPATNKPMMVQFGNKGEMRAVPFLPEAKPPTEAEAVSAGYLGRMTAAEQLLQNQGAKGYPDVATAVAGSVPLVGQYAQRIAMTPEQQQFRQAQEDWVRAKLRKESGAVIGKEEMEREITTYFPMPGDAPQTIAQKQAAREVALKAMGIAAGRAAGKMDSPSVPPSSGGLSSAEQKEFDELKAWHAEQQRLKGRQK